MQIRAQRTCIKTIGSNGAREPIQVRVSTRNSTETQQDLILECLRYMRMKGKLKRFKARPTRRNDTYRVEDLKRTQRLIIDYTSIEGLVNATLLLHRFLYIIRA